MIVQQVLPELREDETAMVNEREKHRKQEAVAVSPLFISLAYQVVKDIYKLKLKILLN